MAQEKSAKRGVCWDEKTLPAAGEAIRQLSPGISWLYNWSVAPQGQWQESSALEFVPMCWNGDFDETALREYLSQHNGEVHYLLAFNEPNLSWSVGGSAMTPSQAAAAWPKVEQVAGDFHLEIVAPALNFTGDRVGDRIWEPFAWYDEFFRLCPEAHIDYIAFHSYMNYYSAVDWLASRYFYSDTDTADESDLLSPTQRAKYPHLVKYMDDYMTAHGHYPGMFLTEFCSWETSSYPYSQGITPDFQIDQMTQKVQVLERSPLVAGYAWFMANPAGGATAFPYMSLLERNTADSPLSTLGQVYVHMSAFDTEKFYAPGEPIQAKDYINASMDDIQVRVRPNTETASTLPLQIELRQSAWAAWQIDVPQDGDYTLTLHLRSEADCGVAVYLDDFHHKLLNASLPSTAGTWADRELTVSLTAGQHTLYLWNGSPTSVLLNTLSFQSTAGSGISSMPDGSKSSHAVYDLQGRRVASPMRGGLYITGGRKLLRF